MSEQNLTQFIFRKNILYLLSQFILPSQLRSSFEFHLNDHLSTKDFFQKFKEPAVYPYMLKYKHQIRKNKSFCTNWVMFYREKCTEALYKADGPKS